MNTVVHSDLVVRRVKFDFSNTPVYWMNNHPLVTHILNPLHLLLPAGELWFCRTFNEALPYITDPKIKADVKGFIGQEAIHSRSHSDAIKFLQEQGINVDSILSKIDFLFDKVFGKKFLNSNILTKFFGTSNGYITFKVGAIAAIEHFTCVMGDWVLNESAIDNIDPVMLDLIRWHGAEEVEHRTVAYDLFRHLCKSDVSFYLARQAIMAIIFPLFIGVWFKTVQSLIKNDPNAPKDLPKNVARLIVSMEILHRKTRLVPGALFTFGSVIRWFSPNYNPAVEGNAEDAIRYFDTSKAVLEARKDPVFITIED